MGFASDNPVSDYLDGNLQTPDEMGAAAPPAEEAPPVEGAETTDPVVAPAAEIDWSKRVEEWGGEQSIQDALAIAEALGDDDGIQALVTEGLRALGYDPAAVFAAKGAPVADEEEEDPDRLVTAAEVEARIQSIRAEQAAQESATADAKAAIAIDETITELSLNDDEQRIVLTLAQKFASPEERNPGVLSAAIKAGHAEFVRIQEEAAQKYVLERKEANDSVPTPLTSGGVPGGEEAPQVKNLDEAKAAARRYLADAGEV